MKRIGVFLLAVIVLSVLAGCGQVPVLAGTTPQPKTTPSGTVDPAAATKGVLTDPNKYLGQEVTVEGILEAEGQGRDVRFFLRGSGEARLEVSSWAPTEVIQPPKEGGTQPKIMSDYVGRNVRLTGVIDKGGDTFILNVAKAEVLP